MKKSEVGHAKEPDGGSLAHCCWSICQLEKFVGKV